MDQRVNGQLGLGLGITDSLGDNLGDNFILVPIDLGNDFIVKQFDSGYMHNCAVSIEGRCNCFGYNGYGTFLVRYFRNLSRSVHRAPTGQLGYGDTIDRGEFASQMGDNLLYVPLGDDFIVDTVALGAFFTCALSTNHTVKCWGDLDYVRIGDEPYEMGVNYQPSTIDFGNNFTPEKLFAGYATACAVSIDKEIACWGAGDNGILGQGNADDSYEPVTLSLGGNFDVVSVSVGYFSACALNTDGDLKVDSTTKHATRCAN